MKNVLKIISVLVILLGLFAQVGILPVAAQSNLTTEKPGKPVLVWPYGSLHTSTPYFRWKVVPGATSYYFEMQRMIAKKVLQTIRKTYNASQCGPNQCKMSLPAPLIKGSFYRWRVYAVNAGGFGPASDWMELRVHK